MIHFLTQCNFTRLAIESMFNVFITNGYDNKTIYVIDSRFFKTLKEMNNYVRNISRADPPSNILIIIGSRFRHQYDEKYYCGLHLQASVKLWFQIIQKTLNGESNLQHAIRCLNYYCYPDRLTSREHEIFMYIKQNNSISEISKKVNVKEKSVYQYIFKLQRFYNQPSLSHLYFFIQEQL